MRSRFHRVLVSILLSLTATAAAGESSTQPRAPVPDGAALEASQKAAADLYGDRFRSAKTLADKTAVAADMIEAALQLQDGSADQYVLLKIAREIAAGAGDAATALQAAEKQAERFDVSAAKLEAETLLTAAREAATTAQHKAVAEAALPIVGSLTDADEIELALDVGEAGRAAAAKSRQFALVKELAAKADDLKKQQASSAEYRRALAVMDNDPAEPAANLAAGRYLCLVKHDWVKGVPMLALGSDAALKAVALMELRGADSAEQQAAIGDAWWDAAETRQGAERDMLRLRAGFWYRQAAAKLGGLAALKIKQRRAELDKLGREVPATLPAATAAPAPAAAIAPFDDRTAKRHQTLWAKHLGVPVVHRNAIDMTFVLIPPGEFEMGSSEQDVASLIAEAKQQGASKKYIERIPAEAPKHHVKITKPFYLGVCEVTQEQYQRVMGSNPSKFQGIPSRPVERVSWVDAVEYCRKLSELPQERTVGAAYRLPTEAEWEYACRAGMRTRYSFGDGSAGLSAHAWSAANSQQATEPVGRLRPNAWGLFDVHGNVWEWCADGFAADFCAKSPTDDPLGAEHESSRVVRGGSWLDGDAGKFRCAFRARYQRDDPYVDVGFRIARTIAP